MPRYTYRGDAPVLFSQYLDVTDPEHVTTLTATPGETYDIKQADGYEAIQPDGQFEPQELPMPPDGDWESADGQESATTNDSDEPSHAGEEPAAEPAAGSEPAVARDEPAGRTKKSRENG